MNIVIHSIFNECDCNALSEFTTKHNNSKSIKAINNMTIIGTCLAVPAALLSFVIGEIECAFILIACIAALWAVKWYTLNKKIPATNKRINSNLFGGALTFAFYDDYLYEKSETPFSVSETSMRYELFEKVSETYDNFFFCINEAKIVIVPKRDISHEQIFELEQFLYYKFGPKFNRIAVK